MATPSFASRLTQAQIDMIFTLRRQGLAVKDIRQALQKKHAIKTSESSVYCLIRGIDPELAAKRPAPKSFAKMLSAEQKNLLVVLRADYDIHQPALCVMIKTMWGLNCSPPTLSNFFKDCGVGRQVEQSPKELETLELVKCPHCGKLHKMWIHRAKDGNTRMLYKYHQECLEKVRRIEDGEEDEYGAANRG